MDRPRALVTWLLVAITLVIGFTAGWYAARRTGGPDAEARIESAVATVTKFSTCLQKDLCGEAERMAEEPTFDASRTEAHEQMNAAIREAVDAAGQNPALLGDLKRELAGSQALIEAANDETADLLADVLLSGSIETRHVEFLTAVVDASGASDVFVRLAQTATLGPDAKAVLLKKVTRAMRENGSQLEEMLAGLTGTTFDEDALRQLVQEACAYQRNPQWRGNWPWVSYHIQRLLTEEAMTLRLEEACDSRPAR